METNNIIPKDCTQCSFTTCCSSYYGGTTCKYNKEISEQCNKRFWERFKKTNKPQ